VSDERAASILKQEGKPSESRVVSRCWPSAAQSFLVSRSIGTHDDIFVRFRDCCVVLKMGPPLLRVKGDGSFKVGATSVAP
jgi:hypothetical protein